MSDKYNGWTNYETWNAALWLDNNEQSQGYWQDAAQECYDDATAGEVLTREETAAQVLAERLKASAEESMPEVQGMYADMLTAAMGEINWDEIAAGFIAEVDKAEA